MKKHKVGQGLLIGYLAVVVVIALVRAFTGWPTVAQLASTPMLLAHGEWWRLATSALVVNGPPVPQLLAIALLGSLAIYLGGSWVFWSAAVAGHVIGTLAAYAGFSVGWIKDRAAGSRFLTDPDYGVSLVWCAGLGGFVALAWMGARRDLRRPEHPWLALAGVAALAIVLVYSDRMEAVQHVVAFMVGLLVLGVTGKRGLSVPTLRRIRPPRRHRRRAGAGS
jgi:membrane associated rhomboid family serine protease